jgi:hypothetical protein
VGGPAREDRFCVADVGRAIEGDALALLLMGVGLIARRLLPFRRADDLALQEVILGPLITVAGVLGSSLHWRKSGVFAAVHGMTRMMNN